MQSRRHDDYRKLSPSPRPRNQPRYEVGHDSYVMSRHEAVGRSPRMLRRSLSPRGNIEGSRRVFHGEAEERRDLSRREAVDRSPRILRRSFSPRDNIEGSRRVFHGEAEERREYRDYGWHLGGGGRTERVRSRSPLYMHEHRQPHFDVGVVHKQYYGEERDYDDGKSNRKQVYGHDRHGVSSRMSKDLDFREDRIASSDGHGMIGQKPVFLEDRMIRGSYRVSPDMVRSSSYVEAGGRLPLTSQRVDIDRFEREDLRYRETITSDKLPVQELYKKREDPIFHSRDGSYTTMMTLQPTALGSTSEYRDVCGISSGISRNEYSGSEFPSSCRDGMPLLAPGEYSRGSVKLREPLKYNIYRQRSVEDIRDHESGERSVMNHLQGAYSGKRDVHDSYIYPKSQRFVNDDMYPSDDLHSRMCPNSQFDYENAQTNFEHRESSRPIMHPSTDMIDHPEDYSNVRKRTVWDHHAIQSQADEENIDTSRMLHPLQRDKEYLDCEYTQVDFERKESRENEISHLGVGEDHQNSHRRSGYGFGRDAGPQFQREILRDSPISDYDLEMQRLAVERKRVKEDLDIYEQTDKYLKRKYIVEEEINRYGTRSKMSSNQTAAQEFEHPYDSGNEWVYEGADALHVSETRRIDHYAYRNPKRKNDGRQHSGDFAYKEWLSSQDSLPHQRRHPAKQYKPGVKYSKGQPKPGSLSRYNLDQTDKRTDIHRQHKILKHNDNHGEDAHAHDDDTSEYRVNLAECELLEDSEEFKQLVEEAYLLYSKQLNLNSAVRRRYKEQGKAGSLFCIVCGRSSSKEFMDTRRLLTHAYMSHKTGLRARHLGLHKAICVMMGWNSFVPSDTITWVPEVLPDTEALAQKEDLMLWPPLVIIHNISMSNNSPEKQKVVPIDGVEAFLRGKGFVGGKIKVCLGKPADQSVMLVKFLGTFTGLGNAERLHRYFLENKHGRIDFGRISSNNSECSRSLEAGKGENSEEQLLYGYIGIAEDFDRLDFNTKKWIMIKSRKEIQELANAPVKTDDP